jgi:hypothetical protein
VHLQGEPLHERGRRLPEQRHGGHLQQGFGRLLLRQRDLHVHSAHLLRVGGRRRVVLAQLYRHLQPRPDVLHPGPGIGHVHAGPERLLGLWRANALWHAARLFRQRWRWRLHLPAGSGVRAAGSVCTSTTASAVCSVDAQGCFYKSSATTCANRTCVSGSCAGACTSGQAGCTGPSAATPETCGTTGQWNVGTVTANQCGAVCNPGASQCNGATPQTCSSVGQWVSGAITAKVCGAACTPGTSPAQCSGLTPQTCGADGKWQNGATCPFVCSAGACTGACSPGDTQCCNENTGVCGGGADSNAYNVIAQTCNSAGQWSTAQCGHVCSGNLAACSTNCGAVATCAVVISPGECGCP